MNRVFASLYVVFFLSVQMIFADEIKTLSVEYSMDNFSLIYDSVGCVNILSYCYNVDYDEIPDEPALPLIPLNVLISSEKDFNGITVNCLKKPILDNVVLAANPIPMKIGAFDEDIKVVQPLYEDKVYPSNCIKYVSTTFVENNTLLNFLVCPFEYDAINKRLFFIEKIDLNIRLRPSVDRAIISQRNESMHSIIENLIINPDELDVFKKDVSRIGNEEEIEYVIITSSKLALAFQPLIRWKKMKGVRSKVISDGYIERHYEGATMQEKIKSCLYDFYKNRGLKYVLLGGDEVIVPAQGCYGIVAGKTQDKNIPTDLYYACFDGNFRWDGDGDGIYGEIEDNIVMTPSVFVTRIPVRTAKDVAAFVSKLICYEQRPILNEWNDYILMSGKKLWGYESSHSDAELKGDKLYENYIAPFLKKRKFYDTYTDFAGGAGYTLNSANLQEQLSQGYAFVDMITHGSRISWALEEGRYVSEDAKRMSSLNASIITTMACSTNAFDGIEEPCLSEAFIRNDSNGVVAYLGCSREGWGTVGPYLGVSLQYEARFYQNLFSSSLKDKNYGAIVAAAKMGMLNFCGSYGSSRWVQFGLNPIGDPEMPIYITKPLTFHSATVMCGLDEVVVDAQEDGCTICVMSNDGGFNDGHTYYDVRKGVRTAIFSGITSNVTVCITKQNFIPKVFDLAYTYIQNKTIDGNIEYDSNVIKVGTGVIPLKEEGPVVFDGKTITLKSDIIYMEPEITVTKNAELILLNK